LKIQDYNAKILIVDDDPGVRESYNQILASRPDSDVMAKGHSLFDESSQAELATPGRQYDLTLADCGEAGVEAVEKALGSQIHFAAAFVDMMMPGIDGAETAKKIWDLDPDIKIVIVTAYSEQTPDEIVRKVQREDLFYLRKPFNPAEIRQFARALTKQWNLEQERQKLSAELGQANQQLKRYAEDLKDTLLELRGAHKKLARLRESEIDTASKIQEALLLGQPPDNLHGIQVSHRTIASEKVDGDFYDFYRMDGDSLDVVVGDVMGKGIPAALVGAALKSQLLRALNQLCQAGNALESPKPESIVAVVQAGMIQQLEDLETFATLIYARFDLTRNLIQYVDCGHTRTIHFQKETNTCRLLEGINMPLGFPEKEAFTQMSAAFKPGDLFVFYSDGLTEAKNAQAEMYGEQRLVDFVQQHGNADLPDLIQDIRQDVVDFAQSEIFSDDFTCVGVKIMNDEVSATGHSPGETLEIESDLNELARVREFVRNFCARASAEWLDRSRIDLIELAVNEAVVNVIKHAYRNEPGKPIRIEAQLAPDQLMFRLVDWGSSFDPAAVPPPAFDGSQDHGFGVYIINQAVDEVEYTQTENGENYATMTINLRGGS
jgi:sigma-B regulation protein RsbU (phosphoserine phosphatase)